MRTMSEKNLFVLGREKETRGTDGVPMYDANDREKTMEDMEVYVNGRRKDQRLPTITISRAPRHFQ